MVTFEWDASIEPGIPAIDKQHDQFVDRLRHIQVEFIDGHQMSETILDFLVDWLICHIKGTDQNYSRFMQKQNLAI